MALDGLFLSAIKDELAGMVGARVEKINQPAKDELVLTMRSREGGRRILISANPASPRIHFTNVVVENPKAPPMFCMLLRKHIGSGKLLAVEQVGSDRILRLVFQTVNELGDIADITMVIEIMGRQSNIIIVNENGKIIDAIKRVTDEQSSARVVLPSASYSLPPIKPKLRLYEAESGEIAEAFRAEKGTDSAKALIACIEGMSPLLAREIIFKAQNGIDIEKNNLSEFYINRIAEEAVEVGRILKNGECRYTAVFDEAKKIKEYSFIDINQYGRVEKQVYATASELLDSFYAKRDRDERMKQRSHDMLKLLVNTTERITRKLALQEKELEACKNREQLKICGDIISANLYRLTKGAEFAELENFYKDGSPIEKIKLDKRYTPVQNAQKYYSEYRKAATAEKKLAELMAASATELEYLDSVFDSVTRAGSNAELDEIREELAAGGYMRFQRKKKNREKEQPPARFISSDGYTIYVGRNNRQNDKLTLKTAHNYDMWLHAQGAAGSHVIIVSDKSDFPDRAIYEAAVLAAYHSKGRNSENVAVDYTLIKNVKKPPAAKPGMVIFTDYKTVFVTPDEELVERLAQK